MGANIPRILLPEGGDERVVDAATSLAKDGRVHCVLSGERPGADIIDHKLLSWLDVDSIPLGDRVQCLRARWVEKGRQLSDAEAEEKLCKSFISPFVVLRMGLVDGVVMGVRTATEDVLRGAISVIGTKEKGARVSSFFSIQFDQPEHSYGKLLLFADCAMNIEPDAKTLSHLAINTAQSAELLFGLSPRVAFLSFSTNGSAVHPKTTLVAEATRLTRLTKPELSVIGEVQLDAALDSQVLEQKYPNANFQAPANILIFPDLNSANIGYKLVQRFTSAIAVGPVLQGLSMPVNDLSRGASIDDIKRTILLTAQQTGLNVY